MRDSCKIAGQSHEEVMRFAKPGMTEHVLGAKMEFECKLRGAERLSYPCVVAGGINANTLHYITCDMVVKYVIIYVKIKTLCTRSY
jgi:Xaa-Pro aminopeptidase